MSGQWEVVGKKKDRSNGKPKALSKEMQQQQQKLLQSLNVEDVLSMSQLKNLHSPKGNKENQKPSQNAKKDTKEKQQQQQQQQQAKQPKKPHVDNKPKFYKSIDLACNAIKPDELSAVYDKNKVVYPTTPIVWLRELAQFLNTHINVDVADVVFTNKPDNYPFCSMPIALRAILDRGLKQAGADNCALFFDICLTSMANDMNKNLPAVGYKIFIQLLLQQYPQLAGGNIAKYAALRNSYQNRPNIGLSILWALGQSGYKDLAVGLTVFQDIMSPLLDMKNYTRYILKYLISILQKHSAVADASLTREQYLYVVEVVYGNKKNMTADLTKELVDAMPHCNSLVLNNCVPGSLFTPLLKEAGATVNKARRNHLCSVLTKCAERDVDCLSTWRELFGGNLSASAALLHYIDVNWKAISGEIDLKAFKQLMASAEEEVVGDDVKTQENALDCLNSIKRLNKKMAGHRKKSGSRGRCLAYLTFFVLGAFVFADVRQNGGWSNSRTLQALNRTGVYNYSHKAYDCAFQCTQWVHKNIEQTFPGITETTIEYTAPYVELGHDLGVITCKLFHNAKEGVQSRVPFMIESIESYAPGLIELVQEIGKKICDTTTTMCENTKDYLFTQVFVGKLAPEEIQKTIAATAEAGMEKATEYYNLVCNKIALLVKK